MYIGNYYYNFAVVGNVSPAVRGMQVVEVSECCRFVWGCYYNSEVYGVGESAFGDASGDVCGGVFRGIFQGDVDECFSVFSAGDYSELCCGKVFHSSRISVIF